MEKEITAEEWEHLRPRVVIDLRIVVNKGDVRVISTQDSGSERFEEFTNRKS